MKLAQALMERADIQRRIAQLNSRLQNNAKVQDGEEPSEAPEALLAELEELSKQLEELITRINITNSISSADDGHSLTSLLAKRDCLTQKLSIMRDFLNAASSTVSRMMHSEIKIFSTVNVSELQKKIDFESKCLRELEVQIQTLNWTIELQ